MSVIPRGSPMRRKQSWREYIKDSVRKHPYIVYGGAAAAGIISAELQHRHERRGTFAPIHRPRENRVVHQGRPLGVTPPQLADRAETWAQRNRRLSRAQGVHQPTPQLTDRARTWAERNRPTVVHQPNIPTYGPTAAHRQPRYSSGSVVD